MRGRDDCIETSGSGPRSLPVASNSLNSRLVGKLESSAPAKGSPNSGSPLMNNSPISGSPSRSRTTSRTQSKNSLVTNATRDAGRTPQTKRKELTVGGQRDSPGGSPRNTNPRTSTKRTRKSQDHHDNGVDSSKKNSTTTKPRNGRNSVPSLSGGRRGSSTNHPPLTVSITPVAGSGNTASVPLTTGEELAEREKFDQLWKVKTVDMGKVRIPPNLLDDLIRKESIEEFYVIEDKPVAR